MDLNDIAAIPTEYFSDDDYYAVDVPQEGKYIPLSIITSSKYSYNNTTFKQTSNA